MNKAVKYVAMLPELTTVKITKISYINVENNNFCNE